LTLRHSRLVLIILLGSLLALGAGQPKVFISFDHLERPPASRRDLDPGLLYLRIRNNTRAAIHIFAGPPEASSLGVDLLHEIVEASSTPAHASGWVLPPSRYSPADVVTTVDIQPNADLLFSVPLNHVGPWWKLRIAFRSEKQPDGLVDFTWADVPKNERHAWKIDAEK
jgi:hypothetical protein